MIDAHSEAITSGLRSRQLKIGKAQDYLAQTQELFEQFGSPELKASHAKFAELSKSLESDRNVLLVVVGEFSRGKSSLVNALLGIELLRYAKEATTAVNTFIRALPPGYTERFIRVHFLDGRAPEELEWKDAATLERWSTELDKSHADARRHVDHIEILMAHPLLDQGLVLIDTPGLQSLVAHHESITRNAIAEAHIAIWVQSAQQLGGNATEWSFLSQTIRKNFSKFITVVNMWDDVLESQDPQEVIKTEAQRASDGMDKVKANFYKYLEGQPVAELNLMTNEDHLMGVSALWAMSSDPAKQRRSGVPRLAARIRDLFTSGEALEQVYLKPLKQMLHIQEQLADGIGDQLTQLASKETLAQRQRDLDLLDQEIKTLDLEMGVAGAEARSDHARAALYLAGLVERELIVPLANMKAEIDERLTASYVEAQVAKKVKKIGLPSDLARRFTDLSGEVEQRWEQQKKKIQENLEGLREQYAERMAGHVEHLNTSLRAVDISLAPPQVSFELDLSHLESYHAQTAELKEAIAEHEDWIESLQGDSEQQQGNEAALNAAREAATRARDRVDRLGPQPAPRTASKTETHPGGLYKAARTEEVTYTDYSQVETYMENLKRDQKILDNKEAQLEAIIKEEHDRTGKILSNKVAASKYQRKLDKLADEMQQATKAYAQAQRDVVGDTLDRLRRTTAGQLANRITYLRDHVGAAIQAQYAKQLELLEECVQEQFVEPLNAKRAQREDVQKLLKQSQEEITRRVQLLGDAKSQIAGLITLTKEACTP